MKTRFTKMLSVLLVAVMFVSSGALMISSFSSDAPIITINAVDKDTESLTASINLTSGTFNSIDLDFEMSGLVCRTIEKGDFSADENVFFVSNPSEAATNNIAMISYDGITPGTLAVVTFEIVDDSYTFNVNATACTVAGDENVDVEPVIISNVLGSGHRYSAVVTDPTCEGEGYTTYTCPCGESYTDNYVASLGHNMGEWVVVDDVTCMRDGVQMRICERCKDREFSMIPAKGHIPGEWIETTPATLSKDGAMTRYCVNCEMVLGIQSIPKLGVVHSVSIPDMSMEYKTSSVLSTEILADRGVEYTVTYSSSNPLVVSVDEYGHIYAVDTGSAEITCTVTDEHGNVVTDTATVEVKYVWWQWIIVILLFGWIWY